MGRGGGCRGFGAWLRSLSEGPLGGEGGWDLDWIGLDED